MASDGWVEPAAGCYAIWLRLAGPAAPIARATGQLVASVESAGLIVRDVVTSIADSRGAVALEFAKAPYQGVLRAELARSGELEALACAWNQREPTICAPTCKKLLEIVR